MKRFDCSAGKREMVRLFGRKTCIASTVRHENVKRFDSSAGKRETVPLGMGCHQPDHLDSDPPPRSRRGSLLLFLLDYSRPRLE